RSLLVVAEEMSCEQIVICHWTGERPENVGKAMHSPVYVSPTLLIVVKYTGEPLEPVAALLSAPLRRQSHLSRIVDVAALLRDRRRVENRREPDVLQSRVRLLLHEE